MYQLTEKVLEILNADKNLQLRVATVMGNGYMAVHMDLIKGGRAISKNYDALTYLEKHLKMPIKNIRKKIKQ